MTNHYESANVPGIFFAGTIGQGVAGLKKYGIPANSGAVHGARYNARLMVEHVAEARLREAAPSAGDQARGRHRLPARRGDHRARAVEPEELPGARAISRVDGAIVERASSHWPTSSIRRVPTPCAITVETDDTGDIHPEVYVRRRGRVDGDARLDGSPLHEYRTSSHRRQLASLAHGILPAARS